MKWYLILFIPFITGCDNQQQDKKTTIPHAKVETTTAKPNQKERKEKKQEGRKWNLKDFYSPDKALEQLVDSIYNSLGLAERAAQMIMTATSEYKGIGLSFPAVLKLYRQRLIGGILFLKGRKSVFAQEAKALMKTAADNKILSPIFSCDCEPSLFHKKFTDADSLTATSDLQDITAVEKVATTISIEMKRLGIHWNFAPVADINYNKEIIDNRSFGSNNNEVVEKSVSFILSSANNDIATSVKHFPGHGAVKGDSHKKLVYIDSVFAELDNFKNIIQRASPVSVMVGHIAVKNNREFDTKNLPASLSEKIIRRLLKDSLGFRGIVVTDAMNMGAVKDIPGADLKAVLAGNDLILYPQHTEELHRNIVKLLKTDGKKVRELANSIKKIIRLKICLGLLNNNFN